MKFHVSKQFKWDIQECIPRYYQATGQCEAPPFGKDECHKNGDCPTKTIVTVMACDVSDACRQIKNKFKNFKLEKLVMFKKPALTRDDNGEDPTCNIDVTPGPNNCADCCDLLAQRVQESSSLSSEVPSLSPEIGGFSLRAHERLTADEYAVATSSLAPHSPTPEPKYLGLSGVSNYSFWGSGTLHLEGAAPFDAPDGGELAIDMTFTEEVSDISVTQAFVPVSPLPLPQTNELVQLACCPALFSLNLELHHTFDKMRGFSQFLKTNGFKLPGLIRVGGGTDFIKLTYNLRNDQWQGSVTYTGQSPQGSFTESWNISIQFGCEGERWKFSLAVTNTQPNKRYLSRLLSYYKTDTVCPTADVFFGFKFVIDTSTAASNPSAAQPLVINDDAGFFRDLRLAFRVLPQNRPPGSYQTPADNTAAYDATLTGGT